ncbi:MAG: MBL fold metallo-hydrolase [Pseudomonadota bacterium]
MTGTGTNTYVLHGPDGAVVIDPGPALPAHLAAVLAAVGDVPLQAILVTHPHLDHSALVPALKAATEAQVYGFGPAEAGRSAVMQRLAAAGLQGGGEGVDLGFAPDVLVSDGTVLALAGLQIEAIHTPGHMGGHLCFALGENLFSGDHVMGWASTLISPPDGDMAGYMASLARLSTRDWRQFWPGHGETIADPAARLAELAAHRRARETAICAALQAGPARPADLAAQLYTDTPPALLPAAARNILAHLIDLHDRNVVTASEPLGPEAQFKII